MLQRYRQVLQRAALTPRTATAHTLVPLNTLHLNDYILVSVPHQILGLRCRGELATDFKSGNLAGKLSISRRLRQRNHANNFDPVGGGAFCSASHCGRSGNRALPMQGLEEEDEASEAIWSDEDCEAPQRRGFICISRVASREI